MIARLQVAFIVIVSIMIIVSLLTGCPIGGGNNETYMQCYDCYDEDCNEIMYISPEIKNVGTGGIK